MGLPAVRASTHTQTGWNLAAWSVEAGRDGTVTVTIRQLTDADRLSATLRQAGVPAKVEFKTLKPGEPGGCAENGQPNSPQLEDVVDSEKGHLPDGQDRRYVFHPDLMPPGTSLHIVIFWLTGTDQSGRTGTVHQWVVQMGLVDGDPLPCQPPPIPKSTR